MQRRCARNLSLLLAWLVVTGCENRAAVVTAELGAPLPGLSAAELADFRAGRALFDRDFTVEQGLGPLFNGRRCSSCHDVPRLGGMGADLVRKATRFEDNRCDLLVRHGGDLLQDQATEALRAHGVSRDPVPKEANAVAEILPPALYGAGLIEGIPDAVIMEHEDPDDRDGDGISGRAGRTFDGRLGRFGRKGTFANLRTFTEGALHGEMGITTRAFPKEEPHAGAALPPGVDPAPDPELADSLVEQITRFVRFLAAPAPDAALSDAARDSARAGQQIFGRIGCAACHLPELRTGDSPVSALRDRSIPLYSDLLLHDLGPEMASVCAPNALPSEWRTAPLMGLRFRNGFLHDRRAQSVESAIRAHGGEAARSRNRFLVLEAAQRAAILRFLATL